MLFCFHALVCRFSKASLIVPGVTGDGIMMAYVAALSLLIYTETMRLIRDGEKGVWRWGERETIIPVATLSPPE